jgi:epoxyqueuosine reductase QueG
MVNSELDRVALSVSKKIQEMGSKAYPIPASQTLNDRRLEGIISHKLVANMSGLGWIGKNCLLITPEHGPRVRLATVLTDAQIETGTPLEESCGDCNECVEICPPRAFTGVAFDPSEPRDVRFRAHMCRNYTNQRRELLGEGICGLCVYACPYGKKLVDQFPVHK